MTQKWSVALFCGSVIYLTLFYQLGNLAFLGADEPRYARIGEEMNLRDSYITPTLNFRPWLEKPPLLFWLEAGSFQLFGVHEWSARLPVGIVALLSLLMMALLAFKLAGPRVAILTVLILSTSMLFVAFARAASTDTILVALLSAAMVCGFQATRGVSILWAGSAGVALGLSVLAKGPVAVVLFAGIFGLYFLLEQEIGLDRATDRRGSEPLFGDECSLVLAGLGGEWIRFHSHLLAQSSPGTLFHRYPPSLPTLLVLPGCGGLRFLPLGLLPRFRLLTRLAAGQASPQFRLPP